MRAPTGVAPIASMVVTYAPSTLSTEVMQDRVATPSTCTVQAPHSAMPQPNFVPVIPSTSRSTQSSGVSSSTSTLCVFPLTLMVYAMTAFPSSAPAQDQFSAQTSLTATSMLPPVAFEYG